MVLYGNFLFLLEGFQMRAFWAVMEGLEVLAPSRRV